MTNLTWTGTATAVSSISHGSETRGLTTMMRRESIIGADGELITVPLISGNAFRGRLRRVGEEMMASTLKYRGRLTVAAAAALRSGGALTKASADPISGQNLQRLRSLVPLISVFGCAGAGRLIEGCLQVGKLMPIATETQALLGRTASLSFRDLIQVETYSHVDDADRAEDPTGAPMQFRVETFRAGTQLDVWINLADPTDNELSFFGELLDRFASSATIAGRSGIGHGRLRLDITPSREIPSVDWREQIEPHADEAIELLNRL